MKTTSRGGDPKLEEAVDDHPPETSDLDAAIEEAMQARLVFYVGNVDTSDRA